MDAVVAVGEQLIDHPDRIGNVNAFGSDETLFARIGKFRTQLWSTQIVDVRRGQLLDVVLGRDSVEPCRRLDARDEAWLAAIEWAPAWWTIRSIIAAATPWSPNNPPQPENGRFDVRISEACS